MILKLTSAQYMAVWNAVAQFVGNEQADGDPDNPHPDLAPAEEVLEKLDAHTALLAQPAAA